MGAWLDMVHAAARPPLWLDDTAYTERLLANGRAPWNEVAACVEWRRAALRLLGPAVVVMDIEAMAGAWIAQGRLPTLGMVARTPVAAPLRALLADRDFRMRTAELAAALRASTQRPFAVAIPSPWRWVILAYAGASSEKAEVDEPACDDASLYIADFLRNFGGCGIDALVLRDVPDTAPAAAADLGLCQSVVNVARHYRWDVGLHVLEAPPAGHDFDFIIAPRDAAGIALPAGFWEGRAPPGAAPGTFYHATVPIDADPRRVLERLAVLR